jgi:hypothetical protein
MEEIVPVQLQGEIKGLKAPLSSTSSEPQQILHWGWVEVEFKELALTMTLLVYSCFLSLVKAILFCYFLINIDDCCD